MLFKTVSHSLFFIFFASTFLFVSPMKTSSIEIQQEAEQNFTYSGSGTPFVKSRGNAFGQQTLLVNQIGGEASWEVVIPAMGDYSLVVRYSNDDIGVLDSISVYIDDSFVSSFESEDTGSGGFGWNGFVESSAIPLGQLSVGTTTISLRLDAHDGFGIEYDQLSLSGINIQAPSTPQPISPVNNVIDLTNNLFFHWTTSAGENTYHIQIDNNDDFSSPEIDVANLFDTIYSANNLDEGTTYYWRVKAANACESSSWSVPWIFSTGGCSVATTINAYYHPFQNFDDDVDRIKTFTNFFGGNSGIIYDTVISDSPFISLSYDPFETRTGYGRSLKIDYDSIYTFNIYAESFERSWFNRNTFLNLKDLFPDFANPTFQNRQIDSIVFYGKLFSDQIITLEVKLEDTVGQGSTTEVVVQPSAQWQRFAFTLDDFTGDFNPELAKFVGLNFDIKGQNAETSGTFYLDDMYLVENCFEKPVFSDEVEMMSYLNEVSFRHFWVAVEPESKFALDRHIWDDLISVDAIGFSLSAYVIAHKNGWVDSSLVENRVEHVLTYLLDSLNHTTDTNLSMNQPLSFASVKGIWAHFLDHKTHSRKNDHTEYSIFSTALLLAGVLTTAEYFHTNTTITTKANALYEMTDWRFLLRPDELMYYDWKPESGFSLYYTDWFSEELDLVFLLGISSPNPDFQLPSNPYFLEAYQKPLCLDGDYIYSAPSSNFTYYFLQMYARFEEQTQRFKNSQNALLADLVFCQSEYDTLGYSPFIFGTTACEGPDSAGIASIVGSDTTFISNYHAYGYCCKFDQHNTGNGTVAVYGSGSAALFLPQEVNELWAYYYNDLDEQFWEECGYRFWSPIFGMPDAFHLAPDDSSDSLINSLDFRGPWLSVPRFGIDVGPMLMNIDSYLSETMGELSLRHYFSSHPLIASNLSQFENIIPTDELKAKVNITLTSDQTVCEGELQLFVATGEHLGDVPVYEWFLNGVLVQSGVDNLFSIAAVSGEHSVFCHITSTEHCIEGQIAISDTLNITVLPLPNANANNNSPVCENAPLTLTADGGIDYQWEGPNNFSSNEQSVILEPITIFNSGIYSVTVTNAQGCTNITSTEVIVDSIPIINYIQSNSPICVGDSLEISANSNGINYEWTAPNGSVFNQQEIIIAEASVMDSGTWTLTVTNSEECENMEVINFIVNELPIVSINLTCLPDSIPIDSLPFPLDGCGIPDGGTFTIDGESTNFIFPQPSNPDSLTIVYTFLDANNCESAVSSTIFLIESEPPNAIQEKSENIKVQIFPNPSHGSFSVKTKGLNGLLQIALFDLFGREIKNWNLSAVDLENNIFDLQFLPSGVYLFQLKQKSRKIAKKIVIL